MPLSAVTATPNFEYATTNIPAFLSKLWTLVEDRKYDELIAWDQSGFSFHVFDQTRFAREILPRFFKHNNMASFIRQLNMYGFRKVNSIDHGGLKSEKEDMEFHHPYFIKGKEQFLEFIKRKVPDMKAMQQQQGGQQQQPQQQINGNQITGNNTNNSVTGTDSLQMVKVEELNRVLDEVNTMKSKQKVVDDSLFAVKKENEALWKEIASLRQKHHHQQQIVNKLIHFLVHLVNPSSLSGMKRIRPLMIDGYSNNSAVLQQLDNIAVGGDDEELDSEFIGSGVGGGVADLNGSAHRRHIVELNEDDEEDDYDDSHAILSRAQQVNSSPQRLRGSSAAASNSINDSGEIETINTTRKNAIKHQLMEETVAAQNGAEPLSKKLKTTDQATSSATSLNQNNGLDQVNIVGETGLTATTPDFLDANLFLNAPDHQTTELRLSPSTTNDPAGNIIASDLSQQAGGLDSKPIITLPESPNEMINRPDNNNSLKSYSNSNQMNDHIESLQLDLNSIKDFLSTNSFHQIDQYAINNIFSPLVLDQIENEASSGTEPTSFYIGDKTNAVDMYGNTGHSDHSLNDKILTNNGKIIGNELAHYDPTAFNAAEFITNSQSSVKTNGETEQQQQQSQAPSSQEFVMPSSSNPILLTDEMQLTTPVSFADGLRHPANLDDEDAILSTPLL